MEDKPKDQPPQEKEKRGYAKGGDKRRGPKPRGDKKEEDPWKPVTKLGRLVKAHKIENLVDIFRFCIPIKEQEIVNQFLGENLKEEVMEVKSVQKQTQAGQRTRFKAFAIVGDGSNYIGLGWKCHKEVQGAIKGAITMAKLNIVPVVLGGTDYKAILPPNSYIDVRDFKSPKELANYLHQLNSNDQLYRQYFKWKRHFQIFKINAMCQFCAFMNRVNSSTHMVVNRLDKFHHPDNH